MPRDLLSETLTSHNRRSVNVTNRINTVSESDSETTCPLCLRRADLEQDHDHSNDLCRGRICHACNVHLGRFDRPVAEIQRFLDYLQYWAAQHAEGAGQSYTEYMRVAVPGYRRGRRAPRPRKTAA